MLVMFVIAINWTISFAAMGGRRLLSVLSMGMMRMGMIMGMMPVMGVLRVVSTGIVGSVDRVVYMGMMRIVMTSMMRMVVAMMGIMIMGARRISCFLNGNHKAL